MRCVCFLTGLESAECFMKHGAAVRPPSQKGGFRMREGMEETALSAPRPTKKSRVSSSRLRRVGDDWECLYHEVAAVFPSRSAEPVPHLPPHPSKGAFSWLPIPGFHRYPFRESLREDNSSSSRFSLESGRLSC